MIISYSLDCYLVCISSKIYVMIGGLNYLVEQHCRTTIIQAKLEKNSNDVENYKKVFMADFIKTLLKW